jgi:hypothetical protein
MNRPPGLALGLAPALVVVSSYKNENAHIIHFVFRTVVYSWSRGSQILIAY